MNKKYKFCNKLTEKKIDSIMMVYNEINGDMYELNELGMKIYLNLKSNISIENIINKLNDEYNCEKSIIEKDVSELINRFEKLGIISFYD